MRSFPNGGEKTALQLMQCWVQYFSISVKKQQTVQHSQHLLPISLMVLCTPSTHFSSIFMCVSTLYYEVAHVLQGELT